MEGREQPLSVWFPAVVRVGIVNDHVLACKKLHEILQLNTIIATALKFSCEKQPWMEMVAKSYHVYQYARQGQPLEERFKRQWKPQQKQYPSSQEVQGELLLQRLLLLQLKHLLQRIGSSLLQERKVEYLLLQEGHHHFQVKLSEILYVQADDKYVQVRLKEGCYEKGLGSYLKHRGQTRFKPGLGEVAKALWGSSFVRINESFVIDVGSVSYVDTQRWKHPVVWIGGEDLELTMKYAEEFYRRWEASVMSR